MNELLSQLFLLVIVVMSGLIAWEFYKSRDGQLRVLIISLFITKIWVYGGAMMYYQFFTPVNPLVFRLILNFPMMIIMVKLWRYIRTHNK